MSWPKLISLLLLTMAAAPLRGGITLDRIEGVQSPGRVLRDGFYTLSPASMARLDSASISCASVAGTTATLSEDALLHPLGTGSRDIELRAASYHKFSSALTLWGHAAYQAGKTLGVSGADCIDYPLLAPYVAGDTVGGSLARQRYSFSGGFALTAGEWVYGFSASYRAESAHRAFDPRVKDVVSDLTLEGGVGRQLTPTHFLSIGIAARIYHQDCDIEFVNPMNDILTHLYTGLGTDYHRFGGNRITGTGHTLSTIALSAQWLPTGYDGLMAAVTASRSSASIQLRDFNNITPGKTTTSTVGIHAAMPISAGSRLKLTPLISATLFSRHGRENIFGTAMAGNYETIGSRDIYRLDRSEGELALQATLSFGRRSSLTLTPRAGYISYEEKLLGTSARSDRRTATYGARLEGLFHAGSNVLVKPAAGWHHTLWCDVTVVRCTAWLAAGRTGIPALSAGYTHRSGHVSGHTIDASITFTF